LSEKLTGDNEMIRLADLLWKQCKIANWYDSNYPCVFLICWQLNMFSMSTWIMPTRT